MKTANYSSLSIVRRLGTAIRSPLGLAFGWAALIALPACGGDRMTSAPPPPPPPAAVGAASISIDQLGFLSEIKLDVREQATLTATVRDASGAVLTGHPITWSISTPSVATVSSAGVVTGVGPGIATLTATSDGKSAEEDVEVLALNLTAFQLSALVTDDAGNPIVGADVAEVYYGARPPACLDCNIPFGGFVRGTTDGTGSFIGHFAAAPEAMNAWAGGVHAFAYVVTSRPNYETDRRFVLGSATSVVQPIRLHASRLVTAGDSVSLMISSTDPVYQELDTSPASDGTFLCRTVRVRAAADGVLSVTAVPAQPGFAPPLVELDSPDESNLLAFGTGTVSKPVHAGDVVEVRVAATIQAGAPTQSFVLYTTVAR